MHLAVNLLGPLEVRCDGRPVPPPGGRQRAILALLLLDAARSVARDRLMSELWTAGLPASAAANLRSYLSGVREWFHRTSGQPQTHVLIRAGSGWTLRHGDDWRVDVDVLAFEADYAAGRQATRAGRYAEAQESLRRAVLACRGVPLQDVPQGPTLASRAAVLLAQCLAAVEEYADVLLRLDQPEAVRHLLYAHLGQHPYRERAWAQLMLASYRDGDTGTALEVFRTARSALAEGLGVPPSAELIHLQQAILRRDPALDLQPLPEPPLARV